MGPSGAIFMRWPERAPTQVQVVATETPCRVFKFIRSSVVLGVKTRRAFFARVPASRLAHKGAALSDRLLPGEGNRLHGLLAAHSGGRSGAGAVSRDSCAHACSASPPPDLRRAAGWPSAGGRSPAKAMWGAQAGMGEGSPDRHENAKTGPMLTIRTPHMARRPRPQSAASARARTARAGATRHQVGGGGVGGGWAGARLTAWALATVCVRAELATIRCRMYRATAPVFRETGEPLCCAGEPSTGTAPTRLATPPMPGSRLRPLGAQPRTRARWRLRPSRDRRLSSRNRRLSGRSRPSTGAPAEAVAGLLPPRRRKRRSDPAR